MSPHPGPSAPTNVRSNRASVQRRIGLNPILATSPKLRIGLGLSSTQLIQLITRMGQPPLDASQACKVFCSLADPLAHRAADDTNVAQFAAITGASPEQAQFYLDAAAGNLEVTTNSNHSTRKRSSG